MGRRKQSDKGCRCSPKKISRKTYIEEDGGTEALHGYFDYPRSLKLKIGLGVQLPGLSHTIPITSVNRYGDGTEGVWLRAPAGAFARLKRKKCWRPL